jgi:serine/threonine protein kinase
MGEVYRGIDVRLRRPVAIKILPADMRRDEGRRRQFEQEARTVATLRHSHICVLHDVGTFDDLDFLVMEYLEGETLAARLTRGPLPFLDICRYAIEIADALVETHRSGVIHLDLKPANIMLTRSGAKLLDFGVASLRPRDADATRPPTEHGMAGTVSYMAPEQLSGRKADGRADIFAFGAILYEMAVGQKAFDGAMRTEQRARRVNPRHLRRVIQKCVRLSPDERFQKAEELPAELRVLEARAARSMSTPLLPRRRFAASMVFFALIWFIGPLLAVANFRLLESVASRVLLILLTILIIVGWSLWQWHRGHPAGRLQLAMYGVVIAAAIATLAFWTAGGSG